MIANTEVLVLTDSGICTLGEQPRYLVLMLGNPCLMLFTNGMPIAVSQQQYLSLANIYDNMKFACSPTLCLLPFMNMLQKRWPNVAEKPCYIQILPDLLREGVSISIHPSL